MKSSESAKMTKQFRLNYRKTKTIDLDEWVEATIDASQNSPYKISKLQQYNPIYSEFFELTDHNYDSISLNHKYQIHGLNTVLNTETNSIETKPVFTKFSPLMDPLRYMIGKDLSGKDLSGKDLSGKDKDGSTSLDKDSLDKDSTNKINNKIKSILDFELPKHKNVSQEYVAQEYVAQEYVSQEYVKSTAIPNTDAFFSFLTSTLLNHHDFKHGIDYYGSYLGIQDRFKINIEDDLEYLHDSDFFMQNIGKLMTLENYTSRNEFANFGSRGNKIKIQVSDTDEDLDILADSIENLDLIIIFAASYQDEIINKLKNNYNFKGDFIGLQNNTLIIKQ